MKNKLLLFIIFQLLPLFMNAQTHYISNKIDLEKFEKIKNFILEKGDKQTYRNYDNNNPHYLMDNYDLYLGSDIGQKNINNDPKLSDFNELVIRDRGSSPIYLYIVAVRKGDLLLNKQWLSKSMKERNVYAEVRNKLTRKYIEKEIQTFVNNFDIEVIKSKIVCGDLWEIYDVKPAMIEFVECKKGESQLIAKATYKVKGNDVIFIEKLLIEKYGMGKLKFICCGYENENGIRGRMQSEKLSNLDPNISISIAMFSGNDFLNKDKKNKKPDEFDFMYITLEIFIT